jgi:multidrug efflux pump subunit AcrB
LRPACGPDRYRHKVEDLGEVFLVNRDRPILLKGIADIVRSSGPPQIDRRAQQRVIDVLANPVGRDLGSISAELEEKLAKLDIPPGITVQLRGQTQEQLCRCAAAAQQSCAAAMPALSPASRPGRASRARPLRRARSASSPAAGAATGVSPPAPPATDR